jgi:hypothetical protein
LGGFLISELIATKDFNTTVENSVEKHRRIFVSDSARDGSALCTGASAGTFVVSAPRHAMPIPISWMERR